MGVTNMSIRNTCGALNPLSGRADKHAKLKYEEIRKQSTDISYIVDNTEFTLE